MRTILRLVILALSAGPLHAAERDIVRTFTVGPECSVTIDTYRGAISVQEGDSLEVRVAVHLEIGADTEAETESVMRGLQLAWSANEKGVSVVARHPAETRARFVWADKHQIEPTFRVTVPRTCNLNLKTITGMISVGTVVGHLQAHAENGDVFLRQVGGSVDASTQFGDLVVSRCVGSLVGRVLQGTIRVGTMAGPCDLKNSSGDVEVMTAKAGGHIYAEAGTATIAVPHDLEGDLDVRTSGGGIALKVDPASRVTIDATTAVFAQIQNYLPLAVDRGAVGKRHLVGRLNGGGANVRLHASGGDVTLRTGEMGLE
jgi:DUF4097 and DUF4098 domain-containing protein YvlB